MKKRIRYNFWQNFELIPPIKARLLAREENGHRPLTDLEISKRSGLTIDQVFVFQFMCDWSLINQVDARKFLIGCRVDFCDGLQMDRVNNYLRRAPTWKYLRMSPDWKTKYEPLMRRLVRHEQQALDRKSVV